MDEYSNWYDPGVIFRLTRVQRALVIDEKSAVLTKQGTHVHSPLAARFIMIYISRV